MRRTRQATMNARIAKVAIILAKNNRDSDYAKYTKFRNLYRLYKAKIIKKYASKAAARIRRG